MYKSSLCYIEKLIRSYREISEKYDKTKILHLIVPNKLKSTLVIIFVRSYVVTEIMLYNKKPTTRVGRKLGICQRRRISFEDKLYYGGSWVLLCGITFINLFRLCYNYAKYAALRKIPRVISSSFIALCLRYAAQRRLRRAVAVPTSHIITKNRPQGSGRSWVFAYGEDTHALRLKNKLFDLRAGYANQQHAR